MRKFMFVLFIFLMVVWRVKRGFKNGIMQEIVNILSGVISLICLALVFFAVSSIIEQATSMLIVCIVGLIVLGIAFKLGKLMLRPLLAIGNVSVIGGLNKFLGAVLGLGEAAVVCYLLYKVLDYFGVYIL